MDTAERIRRRQRTNIIVARFIPAFLTAVTVYASYVFVGPLCINYLINTPDSANVPQRINLGIALPVVFFFLLILMASCYIRLLYIVSFDPGYTPKTQLEEPETKQPVAERHTWRSCTRNTVATGQELFQLNYNGIIQRTAEPPAGIDEFSKLEAFVCDRNGIPLWCHVCGNWKADRVHHSRDVGRCVTKMDHFCPWVGGMVGENGFKFFLQFNIYTTLFSLYTMIVMAYFVAEAERKTGGIGNVHWVVVLGIGGFFAVFTFGLALTSGYMTLQNVTTVENLNSGNRTMYFAVLLPPETQGLMNPPPSTVQNSSDTASRSEPPMVSEIDDPSHQSYFSSEKSSKSKRMQEELAASIWQGTVTYPLKPADQQHNFPSRTFAVLKTPPGLNPWNLGGVANLRAVLGNSLEAWLLPFRRSPCADHSNDISRYPLGWEFEQLLEDARLMKPPEFVKKFVNSSSSSAHRKKKRKLAEGWQNGERPDGWSVNKAARRHQRAYRQPSTSA